MMMSLTAARLSPCITNARTRRSRTYSVSLRASASENNNKDAPRGPPSLDQTSAKLREAYTRWKDKRQELEKDRLSNIKDIHTTLKDIVTEEYDYVKSLFSEMFPATQVKPAACERSAKKEKEVVEPVTLKTAEQEDDASSDPFVDKI